MTRETIGGLSAMLLLAPLVAALLGMVALNEGLLAMLKVVGALIGICAAGWGWFRVVDRINLWARRRWLGDSE